MFSTLILPLFPFFAISPLFISRVYRYTFFTLHKDNLTKE